MPDKLEQAIAVALDVAQRRRRGEEVSDQSVIERHPELRPLIDNELKKLKILGNARAQAAPPPPRVARLSPAEDVGSAEPDEPEEPDELEELDEPDEDIRFTVVVEDMDVDQTCFVSKPDSVDSGHRQPILKTKKFRPLWRPATALLRVYHDDQQSFESQLLRSERTVIGRVRGDIVIDHDPLMSSQHAEIVRIDRDGQWQWRLRDLQSTNGTFVNVEKAKLREGDELLLGSGRYRFEQCGSKARLHHIVEGQIADTLDLSPQGTLIGRDKCDVMEAFWDEYMDPKHAFIRRDQGNAWRITNTKSVNGVWYRVKDLKLFRSCFFQLGDQRFGFLC